MSNENLSTGLSNDLARLAERLRTSVVRVQLGRWGVGSGVIWRVAQTGAADTAEAIVITNAHVAGAARTRVLTLRLADAREIQATLIAFDPPRDLAALRLQASGLRAAEIGDSAALRVGNLVVAMGNPLGREGAMAIGVVAARAPTDPNLPVEPEGADQRETHARTLPFLDPRGSPNRWPSHRLDVIQADIRLYPGNSGGPLADARGRVIGINTMIGGGLAFAIPSRTVQQFLAEIEPLAGRLYLGVRLLTVPLAPALRQRLAIAQATAALVVAVETGSPAAAAGIQVGDTLLAVDSQPVHHAWQLPQILNSSNAGDGKPRRLSLLRGNERLELLLVPAVRAAA
jgi:serine protease Do